MADILWSCAAIPQVSASPSPIEGPAAALSKFLTLRADNCDIRAFAMTESSQLPQFRLERSILNDFSAAPSYIMHLAHSQFPGASSTVKHCVASSSSDLAIKLYDYDPTNGSLSFQHQLKGVCVLLSWIAS